MEGTDCPQSHHRRPQLYVRRFLCHLFLDDKVHEAWISKHVSRVQFVENVGYKVGGTSIRLAGLDHSPSYCEFRVWELGIPICKNGFGQEVIVWIGWSWVLAYEVDEFDEDRVEIQLELIRYIIMRYYHFRREKLV